MFSKNLSPISRVLIIALVSGIVSGIAVTAIMWFVIASGWFFFIIPAVMGWSLEKFAQITKEEAEADESLESKVGWTCASIVLAFVLLTNIVAALCIYYVTGSFMDMFLNIPFLIVSVLSVWYGYRKGAAAVVGAYYES